MFFQLFSGIYFLCFFFFGFSKFFSVFSAFFRSALFSFLQSDRSTHKIRFIRYRSSIHKMHLWRNIRVLTTLRVRDGLFTSGQLSVEDDGKFTSRTFHSSTRKSYVTKTFCRRIFSYLTVPFSPFLFYFHVGQPPPRLSRRREGGLFD